ncbi:MAG: 3-dehydroquinate synthase [Phycisphaerales bacterium]|nr:3-dehydroquinate synthase [Phycisphaerales bacterium]
MLSNASIASIAVTVPGGSYEVLVGPRLLDAFGERLAERFGAPGKRAFLVYDAGLPDEHVVAASRSLAHAGFMVSSASVQPTETAKTLGTAARILVDLAETRHERGEPVVALGGGVTCDLAGYVAAVYRRGVPVVHCPTTLLAMVDASVGGKTGVNLLTPAGLEKNMVGVFWQPAMVVADVQALLTLSERDFRAGLAECVKHGMIGGEADAEGPLDPGLLDWIEANAERILEREPATLAELVARNVALKARVVGADEREDAPAGLSRMLLNLGHTFAHAIETIPAASPSPKPEDAPLRHGEAVALGLLAACAASEALGLAQPSLRQRVEALLRRLGLPTQVYGLPAPAGVADRMRSDKKVSAGRLRIVAPREGSRAGVVALGDDRAAIAGLEAIGAP